MVRANFSGAYGHNLQLEVISEGYRQDIAGNFSVINVQVKLVSNGYAAIYDGANKTLAITVGGETRNVTADATIGQNQNKLIFDNEFRVPHDQNGAKTVNINARLDINVSGYGSASVRFNRRLPDIPRASPGSDVTAVIGQPVTININRKNDAFKHAIWATYGSFNKQITTNNVDTSFSWTPPLELCEQTPNSASGFGNVTIITYDGSREIGRDIKRLNLSIPDSVKPTLTGFTLTDTNTAAASVVPGGQAFIQILSNIKVNFGQATGAYGSTVTGYYAEIVGKNQSTTTQGGTLGIMNYTGDVKIKARVIDSRGRTSNAIERTVNILEYFAPILSISATRSGVRLSTLTITRNAKVAPLTVSGAQKNQMKLTFKVAKFGSNDYKIDTGTASGTWTTVSSLVNSNTNLQGEYAANSSWTVLGILEDKFTRTEFSVNVATEQVVFSYDKNGVGVNKIRERGALDVGGDIYANNKPIQQHQLTQNNGKPIRLDRGFDLNNVVVTGLYIGNNLKNTPQKLGMHEWVYVRVTQHDDKYSLQEFVDFNGVVSAYRVRSSNIWKPWQTVATVATLEQFQQPVTREIPMPYNLSATLVRSGNLVTISLKRKIANIPKYENELMIETIPLGFRPVQDISMVVTANANTNVWGTAILHFVANGGIALTNGITQASVWLGTVSYITSDPYPS